MIGSFCTCSYNARAIARTISANAQFLTLVVFLEAARRRFHSGPGCTTTHAVIENKKAAGCRAQRHCWVHFWRRAMFALNLAANLAAAVGRRSISTWSAREMQGGKG